MLPIESKRVEKRHIRVRGVQALDPAQHGEEKPHPEVEGVPLVLKLFSGQAADATAAYYFWGDVT